MDGGVRTRGSGRSLELVEKRGGNGAECFFGCLFPCGVLHADSNVWFNQIHLLFSISHEHSFFEDIIEPNDQTEARKEHLAKIADLVGNVYPNKFARTAIKRQRGHHHGDKTF